MIHVDALSRLPEQDVNNAIVVNLIEIEPKIHFPLAAAQIAEASKKDPILSKVLNAVAGHWRLKASDENIRPFVQNLASLSILHDCLMFSNRVVIALALRARVLELLHSGHPGVVRMKLKARTHVWWPGLSADIEHLVKHCQPCSIINFSPPQGEVMPWPGANEPFERISIDLFQLEAQVYLIVCDSYSK